jgi:hypothetical protein
MLTAVVIPGIVAWVVSRSVTRLALRMRARWRQNLLLLVAVPVVAAIVALLTFVLFELVGRQAEGPNVFVDFGYFSRFALLVPVAIVLVSAARELKRTSAKDMGLNASAA